jgi:hypothetical protein
MKRKLYSIVVLVAIAALAIYGVVHAGTPTGTGFTYQGFLKLSGTPVNTNYDFQFRLFDALTGGNQIGNTLTQTSIAVSNGLFKVTLDFGTNAFNGDARWLDISVQPTGGSGFTTLSPRQQLTSAPYALYAQSAQGAPRSFYPLLNPQSIDLTSIDTNLRGFSGGFTDGRYGYLVPHANNTTRHGLATRIDLQNFSTGGVTVLDFSAVDSNLRGFAGGFTDGRYGYYVPYANSSSNMHGYAVRVDLQNFTTGGVTVLDLTNGGVNPLLEGYTGGFSDGRYAYFVPFANDTTYHGNLVRVDITNFTNSGMTVLDLTNAGANPGLVGFCGGFTDGRYGYLTPHANASGQQGNIVRVDLQDFSQSGVSTLNLTTINSSLRGFYGGFTDGRFGYFVPYSTNGSTSGAFGLFVRLDLQNFTASGVTILDLTVGNTYPNRVGFVSGFTDGRYAYLSPHFLTNGTRHGNVTRVDLQNFTSDGVTSLDMALLNSNQIGFGGGFMDGRHGYFIPNNLAGGSYHGTLARIQLIPGSGAGTP